MSSTASRGVAALGLLLGLVLGGCATSSPGHRADLAIDHVNVIDTRSGGILQDHSILIRAGKIQSVIASDTRSKATRRIDGGGAWAIPGLWDAHLHLLNNDGAAALHTAATLLGHGITHARDMGSSSAAITAFRQGEATFDGPVVLTSGPTLWAIELPYGDKSQQRIVAEDADIDAVVRQAVAEGADFIKVYAGFGPDRLTDLTQAAQRADLAVSGHGQRDLAIDAQASLGLRTLEHLETSTFTGCGVDPDTYFNRIIAARFRGSGETIPGIMAEFSGALDRAVCVAMFERAAAAGLAFTPTLAASLLPPLTARELAVALPADRREACEVYLMGFGDLTPASEATYQAAGAELMSIIKEARVPILAGTDAPAFCGTPGPTLALELHLLADAGLSPLDVLQSATLNPSRALGFGDRLGAVAPGMDADILLLEQSPLESPAAFSRPVGLFTQGQWRDEAELKRLRQPQAD